MELLLEKKDHKLLLSKKDHKLLLSKKDHKRLLLSEVIDDYPSLKAFLEENSKPTSDDLENCDKDVRRIFNNNIISSIIERAMKEWIFKPNTTNPLIIDDNKKDNHLCQYCGHPHLSEVYFIENSINGKVLEVGNSCIVTLNIKSAKDMEDIAGSVKELRRINLLDRRFAGIKKTMDTLYTLTAQTDIVIPKRLSQRYAENTIMLSELYSKYISGKTLDKALMGIEQSMASVLSERSSLEAKIGEYVKQVEKDPLVAKKKYLKLVKDQAALSSIEETGMVGKLALAFIIDEHFMRGLIPRFNAQLAKRGVAIRGNQNRTYQYVVYERNETFNINLENLVGLVGEAAFNELIDDGVNARDIIAKSTFADMASFEIAVDWLLSTTSYGFEINRDRAYDEIIFYPQNLTPNLSEDEDRVNPRVFICSWSEMQNIFLAEMLLRDAVDEEAINQFIHSGERMKYSDYAKLRK